MLIFWRNHRSLKVNSIKTVETKPAKVASTFKQEVNRVCDVLIFLEEEDQSTGGKKEEKEKNYKKKDLQRMTQLLAEISELQSYLQYEHAFLTELLISSFSQPKPEVVKVENFNFKVSSSNNSTILSLTLNPLSEHRQVLLCSSYYEPVIFRGVQSKLGNR